MKTDDLLDLLASDGAAVPRHAAARGLALALSVGAMLAAGLMVLFYGVRSDLTQAVHLPMFWVKLLVPIAVCTAGFVQCHRLARPGVGVGLTWLAMALPLGGLWILAAAVWQAAPASERSGLVWGNSWVTCSVSIAALSLPAFVAGLLALRQLAPTRRAGAGAAVGAMAGGLAAGVYALHCTELAAPFLAVWYVAGMAVPVAFGALLGQRYIRW